MNKKKELSDEDLIKWVDIEIKLGEMQQIYGKEAVDRYIDKHPELESHRIQKRQKRKH